MNRYEEAFSSARRDDRIAFIPFAVAGDPDVGISERVFRTYIDAGADVLEIGYPFSDPMADGPVNQRGAQRAIASGISPQSFFDLVYSLRKTTEIPFGVLMYANTARRMGYGTFCSRASDAGIDSILVADMPPEEGDELLSALDQNGLRSVFIVSELTPDDRIQYICSRTTGFVYVVSRLGVTGVGGELGEGVGPTLARIRPKTDLPLCVGFGLSEPEHLEQVKAAGADGAIVGSRLVGIVEQNLEDVDTMVERLHVAVTDFRKATGGLKYD